MYILLYSIKVLIHTCVYMCVLFEMWWIIWEEFGNSWHTEREKLWIMKILTYADIDRLGMLHLRGHVYMYMYSQQCAQRRHHLAQRSTTNNIAKWMNETVHLRLSNLDSWHSKNLSTHPSRLRPPWPHCAGLSCWHRRGMYMGSCPGIHVPHVSTDWFLMFRHIATPTRHLWLYK